LIAHRCPIFEGKWPPECAHNTLNLHTHNVVLHAAIHDIDRYLNASRLTFVKVCSLNYCKTLGTMVKTLM
jgi:hypothetical protein